MVITATEQRDLMRHTSDSWLELAGIRPLAKIIRPWNAQKARIVYLQQLLDQLGVGRRGRRTPPTYPSIVNTVPPAGTEPEDDPLETACRCTAITDVTEGLSAAAIMRSPVENKLRCIAEDHASNRPPAQHVEGDEASVRSLLAVDPADWEGMLICNETVLDEMAAELLLPDEIHQRITEWERRRVE